MNATPSKNCLAGLRMPIPPPPTDAIAEQYVRSGRASQGNLDDEAAVALNRTNTDRLKDYFSARWTKTTHVELLTVFEFPPDLLASPSSILYDNVPVPRSPPSWRRSQSPPLIPAHQTYPNNLPAPPTLPPASTSPSAPNASQPSPQDRKLLDLAFQDRDELSAEPGFFDNAAKFPAPVGTPGCPSRELGGGLVGGFLR
jgi:hypothetical protein